MSNTEIWDKLARTDPKHTKPFQRAGGFKGTAMKPIWIVKRMTEEFGPCGKTWGINRPEFQVEHTPDESLVYCSVSIWHGEKANEIWGVGGDKVRTIRKSGEVFVDDEAFKKAFTDAVNNALKYLGVGADIHMGQFDDSKYVQEVKGEFEQEAAQEEKARSSAALKRDGVWTQFEADLVDVTSLVLLEKFREDMRKRATSEGWNMTFKMAAKDALDGKEEELKALEEAKVVLA